jgi:hypothetical protein
MKAFTIILLLFVVVVFALFINGFMVSISQAAPNCPHPTDTPTWVICDPCDPMSWGLPGCEQWMCQAIQTNRVFLPMVIK